MNGTYDFIVVGRGIIGPTTAYYLKQLEPKATVLLLDKYDSCCQGNSGKSASKVRDTLASKVGRTLAQTSIRRFQEIQREHDIGLYLMGYLWLMSDEQFESNLEAIQDMIVHNVRLNFYGQNELRRHLPQLAYLDGEAKNLGLPEAQIGMLGLNCGSIDPGLLGQYYETQFRALGGDVVGRKEVTGFILKRDGSPTDQEFPDNKVYGIRVGDDKIFANRAVVTAVGTWGTVLLEQRLGVPSHVSPKTRQLYPLMSDIFENVAGFKCEGGRDFGFPFTILPYEGIYLWRQGPGSLMIGCADDLGREIKFEENPVGEPRFFEAKVMPVVLEYFPGLRYASGGMPTAGQYDISDDGEPMIDSPVPGLVTVGGLTGKGIMKSDAVARITAAKALGLEEAVLSDGSGFPVAILSSNPNFRSVDPDRFHL